MYERKKIVEALADLRPAARELVHATLESAHGSTWCDIAKEVFPDDGVAVLTREPCFVLIVRHDRAIVIDDDRAERQRVELVKRDIDKSPQRLAVSFIYLFQSYLDSFRRSVVQSA